MKSIKKVISIFLAILTLFSICSASTTVFAAEYTEQKARTEYFDSALSGYLKNIVDTEDAVGISEKEQVDEVVEEANGSIARTASTFSLRATPAQSTETAKEAAEDLDIDHTRLTLELEDDENVAYLFSEPVSFIDDAGNLVYKDTNIRAVTDTTIINRGYSYENGDNDYKAYFSEDSSKGLLLVEKDGEEIRLVPNGTQSVGTVKQIESDMELVDSFEYAGVYGTDSVLRFLPQLNGCKEEIVLSSYQGISDFSFTLYTEEGTIAAINSNGEVEIIDSATKDIITTFVAPFANDSSGGMDVTSEHYTDCTYKLEMISEGKYILTISVPEEYLESEGTVYPVIIDPTTDNISMTYDTSVYSALKDSPQSSNPSACFGKTGSSQYGKGRAMFFFKIPSDIEKYAKISSAKLWLREVTGRTETMYVRPYLIKESWNNSVTWSTQPAHRSTFSYPGKEDLTLARRNINSNSTDNENVPYWYAFNITNAVRAWTTETVNKGLKFIAECEASGGDYLWRGFATKDHTTSSYRPYAVISYTNDTTKPTVTVSGNPTKWTNSNVTLTITATDNVYDDDGIAGYSFDNGSTWSETVKSKSFSSNKTVYIKVKDYAGNITSKTVNITKIDKTKPAATITLSPTSWTNGNVTATIKITDNAAIAKYTINGTTTTLDADGSECITSKTVTKTFSANSTVSVSVTDAAGNTCSTVSKSFTNIDKTAPVVSTPTKSPNTEWSNANVTVTNNATDALSGIPTSGYSFDGGSTWQTKTKTYSTEGTYTVTPKAKDNAGNIGTGTAITVKIDKTAPTATVTGTVSGSNVSATINASDALSGLHATPYSFNGGTTWVTGKTATLSANTTHTIKVRDKAGNIRTITYNPKAGTVTASPSLDTWTKGTVTLTASGTNISQYNFDSGAWSATVKSKSYSANTTAKVGFKESSGNTTYINVPITNIDTTEPVINSVTSTEGGWAKGEIKVIVDAEDDLSGISQYSFDGGVTWQEGNTITYTDDAPESVTVMVKDNVGNEASWGETVSLPKYDNGIPASPDLYEQDGLVYISSRSFDFNEETDSSEHIEYKIENGEWTEYDGEPINIVRTYGAKVYAKVVDDATNESPIAEITLENNLGEYTASYTDIALGEGLFPVEFGRTYTSNNGWFFTFDANIDEIDENSYVFTDFYGEKHYFIKNREGKYLSVDEEELTVNADSYVLTYGDMTCTFDLLDGKINRIVTDYLDTAYTWNDNGTLTITGGATVTFTDGKPTEITITRTDSEGEEKTKVVKYEWSDDGNLTKFFDAAYSPNDTESDSIHNYAYTNGLLTTNDTETISYSNGRVKLISQTNKSFVKYTYNDTAASTNTKTPKNIGSVTVSDSKGVTDTIPYSDGVYVSSSLDSYSDKAVYAPGEISAGITTDAISNIVYVVESEPQSEEQGTDEPSTGDELESDGETATDNDIGEESNGSAPDTDGDTPTDNEAEGEINSEENDAEQGEDNNAPSAPELPLYEAINENTYVFYDYDEQNRVATELTVLKSRIADITTATFEDAEKVVKAETVYVYASETDNTITDKYVFTYTDDVKLQTEELYQPINNVLFCVSKFTYDSNENIVLEQYFKQETVNETTVDVEYENCTRVYEDENLLSETQQTLVDGVLTTTKKLSYEYDIGDQLTSYTVEEYTLGALRTVSSESYSYNSFGNIANETVTETSYYFDSDANEVKKNEITTATEYNYNIWNQQEKITVTKNNTVDSTTQITYDDLGNISTVTEDGVAVAYTYSNGNVSTITETKELQQDNGTKVTKTVTSVYEYTNGSLISRTNTTKVDEVVTETTVATYKYDDYGNLTEHNFNGYHFTYNTLGSILSASAAVEVDENGEKTNAGIDIVSYTYSPDIKQDVEFSSFGNNQIIDYEYNSNGEITAIKLGADAEPKYEYKYSSEEQKASEDEATTEEEDTLTANLEGEWVKINDKVSGLFKVIQENKTSVYDSDKAFIYSVETSSKDADDANSFDGTVTTIGGNVYTLVTEENEDVFKTNNNVDFSKKYVYNEEKSELERTLTSNVFYTDYGYGDNGVTVLENVFEKNNNGEITEGYIFNYGYQNENISSETLTVESKAEDGSSDGHTESLSYEYDDNDQLTKATSGTTEWTYEYDSRGNIITKTIKNISTDNTVTYTYNYDSVWQDRLISYNGQEIKYALEDGTTDNSNPLVYRGNALTWTMGRQLATFGDISYTYNEDGIRTSKTSNGVTTKFLLDGYNVIEQTDGTTTLHFFYDSKDEVIGFRYNGNDYFYVKNAMSDIIAITDSNKNIVAEYRYDPWGKVLDEENLTAIGNLNPFRYRSYYYDGDIKMYYLQSRYYDAEVGRFVNCDDVNYIGVTESEISYNPFAYCENNPLKYIDKFGRAKYYATIKTLNEDDVLSKAYSLYINSGLFDYKVIKNKIKVNKKYVYSYLPNYKWTSYTYDLPDIYIYMVGATYANRNIKNVGKLGLRTVENWEAYIANKHKSYILNLKDKILRSISKDKNGKFNQKKYEKNSMNFDAFMFSLSEQITHPLVSMSANIYSMLEETLKYLEKRLDKEDKFIKSITSKYKSRTSKVLILLRSENYRYTTIYYQRGIYWVSQTYWQKNKTYYPYK
ncbi:MAG: hypothetical protein IJB74_05370 [Clostridia bacterium]|nr:hypothetical protein [Clostridia bacterium]